MLTARAPPGGCDPARATSRARRSRFGIPDSALFATVTTGASCGAVNAMHDSFTPLGGLVPLLNIQLGEIVFGGVGAGMYGILVYVILAVFLAGLMVGRTPEYLGKKIDSRDVRFASIYVLIPAFSILLFTAAGLLTEAGRSGILNAGPDGAPHPHGFSEVLYAYTSATANNGSAFAGLTAFSTQHPVFYSLTLGLAMHVGRFPLIIAVLAIAGNMAKKKLVPAGAGSFPVDNTLFVGLLVGVILIVGALTFFPALAIGPIVEHIQMSRWKPWPRITMFASSTSLWDPSILRPAIVEALRKLDPRTMAKNPVMFVVEVGSLLVTVLFVRDLARGVQVDVKVGIQLILWLWFTVLFANFAEAMAEGRGKAQADTLRKMRTTTTARPDSSSRRRAPARPVGCEVDRGDEVPATETCDAATWST